MRAAGPYRVGKMQMKLGVTLVPTGGAGRLGLCSCWAPRALCYMLGYICSAADIERDAGPKPFLILRTRGTSQRG